MNTKHEKNDHDRSVPVSAGQTPAGGKEKDLWVGEGSDKRSAASADLWKGDGTSRTKWNPIGKESHTENRGYTRDNIPDAAGSGSQKSKVETPDYELHIGNASADLRSHGEYVQDKHIADTGHAIVHELSTEELRMRALATEESQSTEYAESGNEIKTGRPENVTYSPERKSEKIYININGEMHAVASAYDPAFSGYTSGRRPDIQDAPVTPFEPAVREHTHTVPVGQYFGEQRYYSAPRTEDPFSVSSRKHIKKTSPELVTDSSIPGNTYYGTQNPAQYGQTSGVSAWDQPQVPKRKSPEYAENPFEVIHQRRTFWQPEEKPTERLWEGNVGRHTIDPGTSESHAKIQDIPKKNTTHNASETEDHFAWGTDDYRHSQAESTLENAKSLSGQKQKSVNPPQKDSRIDLPGRRDDVIPQRENNPASSDNNTLTPPKRLSGSTEPKNVSTFSGEHEPRGDVKSNNLGQKTEHLSEKLNQSQITERKDPFEAIPQRRTFWQPEEKPTERLWEGNVGRHTDGANVLPANGDLRGSNAQTKKTIDPGTSESHAKIQDIPKKNATHNVSETEDHFAWGTDDYRQSQAGSTPENAKSLSGQKQKGVNPPQKDLRIDLPGRRDDVIPQRENNPASSDNNTLTPPKRLSGSTEQKNVSTFSGEHEPRGDIKSNNLGQKTEHLSEKLNQPQITERKDPFEAIPQRRTFWQPEEKPTERLWEGNVGRHTDGAAVLPANGDLRGSNAQTKKTIDSGISESHAKIQDIPKKSTTHNVSETEDHFAWGTDDYRQSQAGSTPENAKSLSGQKQKGVNPSQKDIHFQTKTPESDIPHQKRESPVQAKSATIRSDAENKNSSRETGNLKFGNTKPTDEKVTPRNFNERKKSGTGAEPDRESGISLTVQDASTDNPFEIKSQKEKRSETRAGESNGNNDDAHSPFESGNKRKNNEKSGTGVRKDSEDSTVASSPFEVKSHSKNDAKSEKNKQKKFSPSGRDGTEGTSAGKDKARSEKTGSKSGKSRGENVQTREDQTKENKEDPYYDAKYTKFNWQTKIVAAGSIIAHAEMNFLKTGSEEHLHSDAYNAHFYNAISFAGKKTLGATGIRGAMQYGVHTDYITGFAAKSLSKLEEKGFIVNGVNIVDGKLVKTEDMFSGMVAKLDIQHKKAFLHRQEDAISLVSVRDILKEKAEHSEGFFTERQMKYLSQEDKFFYRSKPGMHLAMINKALASETAPALKQLARTSDIKVLQRALKDPKLSERQKTLIREKMKSVISIRQSKLRAIPRKALFTGGIVIGFGKGVLNAEENNAQAIAQIQRAGRGAHLGLLGMRGVYRLLSVVANTKPARYIRNKIRIAWEGSIPRRALTTAKKAVAKAGYFVADKTAGTAVREVKKAVKTSVKKKLGAENVRKIKSGKAKVKKAGHSISNSHRQAKELHERIREKISKPILQVGEFFSTLKKIVLIIFALTAIIYFSLLAVFTIWMGGKETSDETTINAEPEEVQQLVSYVESLNQARQQEAVDIGTGTPKNPQVTNGHTISSYGHPANSSSRGSQEASAGYTLHYVDGNGNETAGNTGNTKDVVSLATVMFGNGDIDEPAFKDLLNDLWNMMNSSIYYQETSIYHDAYSAPDTADIHYFCNSQSDINSLNSQIAGGAKIYDMKSYRANGDGTFSYRCNDANAYTTISRMQSCGYNFTESVVPQTTEGCVTDDYSHWSFTVLHTGDYFPGTTTVVGDTSTLMYTDPQTGEQVYGTAQGLPWKYWTTDIRHHCSGHTLHYCTGHNADIDYGRKDIDIYLPTIHASDVWAQNMLPSGWENKSYARYIKDFVDDGGWGNSDNVQWAEDLMEPNWYELYGAYVSGSSDTAAVTGVLSGVAGQVYDFFKAKGFTDAGIAGILGNMQQECGMNPILAQASRRGSQTNEQYTTRTDNGTYTNFVHDGVGYGLVQFTYWEYKQQLLNAARSKGVSVGDVQTQLEVCWSQIQGNTSLLNTMRSTTSPDAASDAWFYGYEKAGDWTGPLRRQYSNQFMDQIKAGLQTSTSYVNWAISIANDNTHGYSQTRRNGNPDYDCSSLVWYALRSAGIANIGSEPFSTREERAVLKGAGFTEHRFTSVSELQVGDILWRSGHTEIYIGNGQNVGAHSAYGSTQAGDQSGREISVSGCGTNWSYYYRRSA